MPRKSTSERNTMKVFEILGKRNPYKGTLFGIEIEVEGEDLIKKDNGLISATWDVVPDGSLRNGVEYVIKKPTNHQGILTAVTSLNTAFEKAGSLVSFSSRTSVHVHMNVLDMEIQSLANTIYLYYLLEDVFLNYSGELRKENRFCLSGRNAEGIYNSIIDYITVDRLALISNNAVKYSALNIGAIPLHGSLEFRALRGTSDVGVISNWLEAIEQLKNVAVGFKNPQEIFNLILSDNGIDYFIDSVFKNKEYFMYKNIYNDIGYAISLSSCLVAPLSYKEKNHVPIPV